MQRQVMKIQATLAIATIAMMTSFSAQAADIGGTVTDSAAAAISGMLVRVWEPAGKGWSITTEMLTAADGTYAFAGLPAGTYRVDARMPRGYTGNYGDVWHDVAAPNSNGLIFADADDLTVAAADVLTGIDLLMFSGGGFDLDLAQSGITVRLQAESDVRIHHQDSTQFGVPPQTGIVFFRGMAPTLLASNYWWITYDPNGLFATTVGGFVDIIEGVNATASGTLGAMPADSNEPNDAASAVTTPLIAQLPFTASAPVISAGNDVDFYCIDALVGERYIARASAEVIVNGVPQPHPWFDPMIGWWDGAAFSIVNDDSIPGQTYDAELDTGLIATAGRYCFAVSTFGDADFDGIGIGSRGTYDFEVIRGNTPPTIAVTQGGVATPVPPAEVEVPEGVEIAFDLTYSDPQGDPVTIEVIHIDAAGNPVVVGVFTDAQGTGTYVWTPSQTDATNSPFEITFRISDGEFEVEVTVIVRVAAVSLPPTLPVLISPINDEILTATSTLLVLENAVDLDGDSIAYQYEAEFGEPDDVPEFEDTRTENPSGQTSSPIAGLVENTWVSWRARAFAGGRYSSWTARERFFVNVQNDPPEAPVIIKPANGSEVDELQPTIAVTVPEDPEGDDITLKIEIARDADFADTVVTSDPLPPGADVLMLSWQVTQNLEYGGEYFARAIAQDTLGASSPYSEISSFFVRFESELLPPSFGGEWGNCALETVNEVPTEVRVLNVDGTGDTITFEVVIASADAPEVPLAQASAPQAIGSETIVTLPAFEAPPGNYVLNVRAIRRDLQTDYAGCSFSLIDEPIIDPNDGGEVTVANEPDGCGCSSTSDSSGGLLLLLLGLGWMRRRRM
jgi:MYXO-CTERM domain-containing protein